MAYKNKLSQCIKFIRVQSGIDIGLFPNIGKGKFIQVGNAAGAGARMVLLSMEKRKPATEIARHVNYIERIAEKDFSVKIARALLLGRIEFYPLLFSVLYHLTGDPAKNSGMMADEVIPIAISFQSIKPTLLTVCC